MKKSLASLVAVVLLLGLFVPMAEARDDARMREAIIAVKRFFPATDTYREFFTNQQIDDGKITYFFEWRGSSTDPAGFNPSSIRVTVDAERLLITNYGLEEAAPRNRSQTFAPLPKHGRLELQKAAEELAKKLAPTQFATMRLASVVEPQVRIGKRNWPHFYNFHYVQYVNNIPFYGNYLTLSVNADSGIVTSYSLNFVEYTFPAPRNVISDQRLSEIFSQVGLRLAYHQGFSWRFDGEGKPFLAFALEDGRMLHIDALTGEVFRGGNIFPIPGQPPMSDGRTGLGKAESGLTPEELREIELVAGLLTLAKVDTLAREIMDLPSEARLENSRLTRNMRTEERLWNLYYYVANEQGHAWASITLDAASGALKSFYYHDDQKEQLPPAFTRDQARSFAEQFLRKYAGNQFAATVLVEDLPMYPADDKGNAYAHAFTYNRRAHGIPVLNDNLFITVRHDGRVTNYHANWYRGQFVSPQGALSPAQMVSRFLAEVGFELTYVLTQVEVKGQRQPQAQIRLVYQPKERSSYLFDAFTGKNIDWQGEEVQVRIKPTYTDTANHWASADIALLVDLGILRFPGPAFRPDETMNLGDLLAFFSAASGWESYGNAIPDWLRPVANERNHVGLSFAANSNLVREGEEINPEAPVTREMLAFYLARLAGHGETAALEGIWTAPFRDFAQIAPRFQGSVAIVHALRLMAGGQNAQFLPRNLATRAQVAVIIARMLRSN